jgi:hypothetical protein
MKPSILIGFFSGETERLAQAMKRELDAKFTVRLWHQMPFQPGSAAVATLVLTLQCFDFVALLLGRGDRMPWPEDPSETDVIRFLFGLFSGAMGPGCVLPVSVYMGGSQYERELSVFGDNALSLAPDSEDANDSDRIRKLTTRISEIVMVQYKRLSLPILPSTALAQGYFQNFVLPVCQALARLESIRVNGTDIEISGKSFRLRIVLPKTLAEASREEAMRFLNDQRVANVTLASENRAYPFHLGVTRENDLSVFYDYPTTLRASHEMIQIALAGELAGDADRYFLVEEREINNFERTLGVLLNDPRCAEFRDNVEIVRLERS